MGNLSNLQIPKAQLTRDRIRCIRDSALLVRIGLSTSDEDNRIHQIELALARIESQFAEELGRQGL